MAIEIRELVIRATVVPEAGAAVAAGGSAGTGTNNDVSPGEELVKLCVDRVLDILKSSHVR